MKLPEYLRQNTEHGSTCFLFSLCNALRYHGLDSPEPGDKEWEHLIDLGGCRHGAIINHIAPADYLGLELEPNATDLKAPQILTVFNPEPGMALHSCLYVGHEQSDVKDEYGALMTYWKIINYRTDHPAEQLVDGTEIEWPGPPNARHWHVKLKNE